MDGSGRSSISLRLWLSKLMVGSRRRSDRRVRVKARATGKSLRVLFLLLENFNIIGELDTLLRIVRTSWKRGLFSRPLIERLSLGLFLIKNVDGLSAFLKSSIRTSSKWSVSSTYFILLFGRVFSLLLLILEWIVTVLQTSIHVLLTVAVVKRLRSKFLSGVDVNLVINHFHLCLLLPWLLSFRCLHTKNVFVDFPLGCHASSGPSWCSILWVF